MIKLLNFQKIQIEFEIERWAAAGDPGLPPGVQAGHYERQVRIMIDDLPDDDASDIMIKVMCMSIGKHKTVDNLNQESCV